MLNKSWAKTIFLLPFDSPLHGDVLWQTLGAAYRGRFLAPGHVKTLAAAKPKEAFKAARPR
jgi:hypothetical protein